MLGAGPQDKVSGRPFRARGAVCAKTQGQGEHEMLRARRAHLRPSHVTGSPAGTRVPWHQVPLSFVLLGSPSLGLWLRLVALMAWLACGPPRPAPWGSGILGGLFCPSGVRPTPLLPSQPPLPSSLCQRCLCSPGSQLLTSHTPTLAGTAMASPANQAKESDRKSLSEPAQGPLARPCWH